MPRGSGQEVVNPATSFGGDRYNTMIKWPLVVVVGKVGPVF